MHQGTRLRHSGRRASSTNCCAESTYSAGQSGHAPRVVKPDPNRFSRAYARFVQQSRIYSQASLDGKMRMTASAGFIKINLSELLMKNNDHVDGEVTVYTVEGSTKYLEYLASTKEGIELVPEPYGDTPLGLKVHGVDFAKWIKKNRPEFPILLPKSTPKIALHSADVWLPLMHLASDTSMPVFLSMVSNYFYDKIKGKLLSDHPKVHLAVMYQNKRDGVTKKFEFSGDSDSLGKAIERFDLDNFFYEAA